MDDSFAVVATSRWKRRRSSSSLFVLLGILLGFVLLGTVQGNSQQRRDVSDSQPRIVTVGGNLIFQTGANHNITFRPGGTGSVVIDDEDLKQLITLAKENRARIEQLQSGTTTNVESRLRALEDNRSALAELTNRVSALETNVNSSEGGRRLNRRVQQLEEQVARLNNLLTANECASNPCRNGGTCTDLYNGFYCNCARGWNGPNCETDINECSALAGTEFGCQNGATCENTPPGGFSCTCTANWFGSRCTQAYDDCTTASNSDLCAHGTCQNLPRVIPGQPKFRCHCDSGWTTDGVRPQCNIDVNECSPAHPCSSNPFAPCYNIPGSFSCGPCPAGYTGNGYVCTDINECESNNGGCSLTPRVQCINTVGSRQCGPCPAASGYVGDGVTCFFVGICGQGNGGCHPMATCREAPGILGRSCSCPAGYVGDGVGAAGCAQVGPGSGPCANNPCIHGTCQWSAGASYSCVCSPGWSGFNCDQPVSGCTSNPCLNGGTCSPQTGGGYTCTCTTYYTGPNCQQPQQTCGGRLSGESGRFRYPRVSTETYPHGVSCAWVITTSPNKIITLTFPQFKLELSRDCSFDFLQIHDGPSPSSQLIGKYCGSTAPGGELGINTTSFQVYMWFRSDASYSTDGFEVAWTSAFPTCGGTLRDASGTIQSPGSPGNYPNNRTCQWTVIVPLGNTIRFSFGRLAIERHPNCSYDFLEIRDGLREVDPILERYCTSGVSLPQPVDTTGPYATVRFHSDASQTDLGFLITYSSLAGCGRRYTQDNGVLISPDYPNPYPHNAQCVWTISVPSGEVITFNITNIDLEVHRNCLWDYVEVREGLDERGAFLGRFCGNTTPPAYVTTQNNLWVKFRSDVSNRGSGFRATWIVACGGVFTNATGVLRSPYFPNPYPDDRECIYVIRQPEGATITLTFVTFDVEASYSANCTLDFIEVRSGQTADGVLIGKYCGSRVPAPIQSPSNALWIRFKSGSQQSHGSSQPNHGFRATYTTANTGVIAGSGCGGTLTTQVGTLQSHLQGNVYPHGVNCTWFITVTPGFIIRLTFVTFSLEGGSGYCYYDYVEIFDNYTRSNSLGRFCGMERPPVLTSSDNALTVHFKTDSSVALEGFTATYISLNSTTICGGDLRSQVGVVTSPNYPGNYPHNRICQWTITVPSGRQILLNITDFMMESNSGCQYDYLEIRDGGFETSPLIGRYCGQSIDRIVRSQSNRLFLKMQTDYSVAHRGFRLYYDGTVSGCGGDMTSVTGSFVSPNYPMAYARNAECFWQISVSQGSVVNLHFVDFGFENHYSCNYDYVEVRDTGPMGPVLGRLCGNSTPDYIQSMTNRMWIKMRTDYSNSGRGFHAIYYANCNNVLRGTSGVIESPNFPRPYPANRNCTWVIQATLGNRINASFSHFEVQPGVGNSSCRSDYLELRDGADLSGPLIGHYCGQTLLPPDITTASRWLFVRFVSDRTVTHNGFRLEYYIDGCGGTLTGPSGRFTSPNYPQLYPHQRECLWIITVAPGNFIQLTIHDLDIELHSNCSYDALKIYGGPDLTSPLLASLCHTENATQTLASTGYNMVVHFKSDVSTSGRGFNISYTSVAGGCGGNFSTRTGTIMSPNYPGAYPHHTSCIWTITVQPGRSVLLTFVDFELEGSVGTTSCYDYVAVYASAQFNGSQLMSACGNALPRPPVVRSITNQLFIWMRSDGSVARRGFKATYKTGCGGSLSAETNGQLTSPGWPYNYEILNNCTWIISSTNTGDRITLTFLHMDLENNNNNCSDDYVSVLEGNDYDAPEIGRYCGTTVPSAITSTGSALVVNFITDASHQRRGFQATYTKSTSACGGDFTSEHGAFNSPGFPDNYPNSIECVWTITSSQGNSIMLTFGSFNLESTSNCNGDYVEVRQTNSGGRVLGRYCGNQVPTNQTTGNQLWVKFKSNENVTGQGFRATYNSIYGGYLTGNTGQLSSPLYPNNYPNNVDYTWIINVDFGSRIQVTFDVIQMEISPLCYYDYVRLRDGDRPDSPQLGRFCGVVVPGLVTTSSNVLRVEFHTDGSANDRGFLMTWLAVSESVSALPIVTLAPGVSTITPPRLQPCTGYMNSTDTFQTLESPGFPYGYANDLVCVWIITSPPGTRILFQFTNMSLEGNTLQNCFDYVYIYGVQSNAVYSRLCGVTLPPEPIIVSTNRAVVQLRTDSSGNLTGFSLKFKSVCGGLLQAGQGRLTTPGYPNSYPDASNCTWTVQVPEGRTIRSAFDGVFAISGQPGRCSGDYLEVYNGVDLSSPLLGRFCGSQAPSIPESTSNSLTLQFISNSDGVSAAGFNWSFAHIQLACGGPLALTTDVTEGFIASPNYPQNYPQNTDCIWVVTAPANRRVKLDFVEEFEIEQHSRCQFDWVQVRDGGTSNSPLLGSFCGSNRPNTQVATGNVMYIRFHTDASSVRKGFKARLSYGVCGGTINAPNGTITSPNFPSSYPVNTDCEWLIQAPAGHYVTLSFEAFALESQPNCSTADYVEIREYNSTGNVLLLSCGGRRPNAVDSSDRFVYIRFHSNNRTSPSGFKLNFVASVEVCGGQMTTPFGTITSPGYPRPYAHSRVCEWVIQVASGRKVTFAFNDIDLEARRFCSDDFVEVRNGILPRSPVIGRFCGSTLPSNPIESSSNFMAVKFQTDYSVNGRGFSASYSSNSPEDCGGVFNNTDNSGVIESPGFSDNVTYNASEQCVWLVANRNVNSSIAIRFVALDLERQGECSFDFVEIREGNDENGELMSRYCRMDRFLPPVILTPSPSIWIRFVSDIIHSRTGFQLTYTFTDCGGLLTSSNGVINSPNYPAVYSPNTYCAWKISAPEGSQIRLRFDRISFNPATSSNCSSVYLEIFNGGLASSPSAAKYCSANPSVFMSQSNEVRVVFYAGPEALAARGFRIYYNFESAGCGASIHSQEGVIMSPNYPSNYNASMECLWEVTVANGYHIQWGFSAPFELEITNPCTADYVEIFEYRNLSGLSRIGRYCGNEMPANGSSRSNRIRIKFRSDGRNSGNGFALTFTAGCGATFTEPRGVIMSPGYPNNYGNNLNCTYDIIGDPQKYTFLTFDPDHFFVEGLRRNADVPRQIKLDWDWIHYAYPNATHPTDGIATIYRPDLNTYWHQFYALLGVYWRYRCPYDAVEVFSVVNSTRNRLALFCGTSTPQPLGSLGGLSIVFTTDASETDRGWIATYEQSVCGGRLTDPWGTITSPSHPQRYINNANCTWIISKPDSTMSIRLRFETFNLEPHSRCIYDFVAVYDGPLIDPSRLIGKFCGSVLPGEIVTSTNAMVVNFFSDESTSRDGFSAIYTRVYGPASGCGGLINSTSGTIQSIDANGDGLYEADLSCVWQIIALQNSSISLSFTRFNLAPDSCYDYLEVRDGLFETDPVVGRYCGGGSVTPTNFTTTTNMVYIKFYSDSAIAASGFSLRYTTVPRVCGTTFYSSDVSAVLSSPGYPVSYLPNVVCRWTIDAPENERVEVTVTVLDLDNHTSCGNTYLEIRDTVTDAATARLVGETKSILVCGNTLPQPYVSYTRTVTVSFVTGEVENGLRTGFQLNYRTASCNRTYTASNGWIVSPRYPANYPVNAACDIIIQTSPGYKLSLFFAFIDIEPHSNCSYDFLQVFNGSQSTSASVAKLCGSSLPNPIFFGQNNARLFFKTDGSQTHRGFGITYTASENGCGGALTNPTGVFTSPDYPRNIAYAASCRWSIAVPSRRPVSLTVSILASRGGNPSDDCTNSRVTIYDGATTTAPLVNYCTAEGRVTFRATSSRVIVDFTTTNSTTAANIAFQASYTS